MPEPWLATVIIEDFEISECGNPVVTHGSAAPFKSDERPGAVAYAVAKGEANTRILFSPL